MPCCAVIAHCSDNNLPYRDTNGFRKLIVILTATGKVFGLHSGDGRILWTHNTAAAAAPSITTGSSSSSGIAQQQYLRVWKQFHDLKHAPQLAVITPDPQKSSVSVLNGHTGAQLQQIELPYGIHKVGNNSAVTDPSCALRLLGVGWGGGSRVS